MKKGAQRNFRGFQSSGCFRTYWDVLLGFLGLFGDVFGRFWTFWDVLRHFGMFWDMLRRFMMFLDVMLKISQT